MTTPETDGKPDPLRRNMLLVAAGTAAAVGVAFAMSPTIIQLSPDARISSLDDRLEFRLESLNPGELRTLRWRDYPILIARRTEAMLSAMQNPVLVGRLADPDSMTRQQPPYAKNWHRSIDPAYSVLVGVCTKCACVPIYTAEAWAPEPAGLYACPCCNSRYDQAGRAFGEPAHKNLPVPPYMMVSPNRLVLTESSHDEGFTLKSVEQM